MKETVHLFLQSRITRAGENELRRKCLNMIKKANFAVAFTNKKRFAFVFRISLNEGKVCREAV
jgi:hypothetical protein